MVIKNLLSTFLILLFVYLIIPVHILTPTPGGSGLYITPNIISWIFVTLLISIGLFRIINKQLIIYNRALVFVSIGFVCLIVPAFYNQSQFMEITPRLLSFAGGLLLLFSLIQLKLTAKYKQTLLLILLIGISVEVIIGLLQLFILMPFDIQIAGYTPIHERPYGSFMQPNVMASFMATGVCLAFYTLNNKSSEQSNNSNNTSITKITSCITYFCLFSCSLLIITLQSKTGYLGLLIGLLFLLPIFKHNFKVLSRGIFITVLGGVTGVVFMISGQSVDRGENLYQDKHRAEMYVTSTKMYLDKPIIGYGYGSFARSYIEYERDNGLREVNTSNKHGDLYHPHNETLYWLTEGGLMALIGLGIFGFSYCRLLYRKPIAKSLPIIAIIIPILIHTQTEYPFYHSALHWVYFIFFIWLAIDTFDNPKAMPVKNTFTIKLLAVLIIVFTIPFMFSALHTSVQMEKFRASNHTDTVAFNSIANTLVWHDYISLVVHLNGLGYALHTQNKEALQDHIFWASEFVQHKPSDKVYHNMLLALSTLESLGESIPAPMRGDILRDADSFFKLTLPEAYKPDQEIFKALDLNNSSTFKKH
jgi:O-antigen polymerase